MTLLFSAAQLAGAARCIEWSALVLAVMLVSALRWSARP